MTTATVGRRIAQHSPGRVSNLWVIGALGATLRIPLSDDGLDWRQIHDQAGYTFDGTVRNPLRVPLAGQRARHLRLQLVGRTYHYRDAVEVD